MATRVLIVEDDPELAAILARFLQVWGFAHSLARNGRAALLMIQAEVPDVILLDLGLPIVDGWEFARRLSGSVSAKRPFVIAISGFAQTSEGDTGIDLHLTKPVDATRLLSILRRLERNGSATAEAG
jgi:DNA-binding response OmpR family regulator